jgi:hypothetical protein
MARAPTCAGRTASSAGTWPMWIMVWDGDGAHYVSPARAGFTWRARYSSTTMGAPIRRISESLLRRAAAGGALPEKNQGREKSPALLVSPDVGSFPPTCSPRCHRPGRGAAGRELRRTLGKATCRRLRPAGCSRAGSARRRYRHASEWWWPSIRDVLSCPGSHRLAAR